MELTEFAKQLPGFAELSHPEKTKIIGWFLHVHEGRERFDEECVRQGYTKLNFEPPNVSRELRRLMDRRPPQILRDSLGYRLEARTRAALDREYGHAQSSIAVGKLLEGLPAKVPGIEERMFLQEVISCYRIEAFRAAVVMSWNLAFDHLLRWVLVDGKRLASFNTAIGVRYPKKSALSVSDFDDFEEMRESEVVEVLNTARLISGGVVKILKKELDRRNSAAHPSAIVITQHQTEDTITDLVNNVILKH
jgi:hypothetical protein